MHEGQNIPNFVGCFSADKVPVRRHNALYGAGASPPFRRGDTPLESQALPRKADAYAPGGNLDLIL